MQLSHVGACTDLSVIENKSECPKNCDSDDEDGDEVVCGSDGNVYRFVGPNSFFEEFKVMKSITSSFSGQCVSFG